MTDEEARKLAQRMIDTWPTGPRAYVWRDAFIDLEPHYAAAAYRRLLTEQDKPTVARFIGEYNSLHREPDNVIPFRQPTDAISLSEYLDRLRSRAARGSEPAREELERWERHLTRPEPA